MKQAEIFKFPESDYSEAGQTARTCCYRPCSKVRFLGIDGGINFYHSTFICLYLYIGIWYMIDIGSAVVQCLTRDRGALPAAMCCVHGQDTLIPAQYWFNSGRPVPT